MSTIKKSFIKIRCSAFFQWTFLFSGWFILCMHLRRAPFQFEFKWVIGALLMLCLSGAPYFLIMIAYAKFTKKTLNQVFDIHNDIVKTTPIWPSRLPFPLMYAFILPAEDGLFLCSLYYVGNNYLTAAVSATCFALLHYPRFSIQTCIPKGLAYFGMAIFILPHSGIIPIILAHFIVDLVTRPGLKRSGPYKRYNDDGVLIEEGEYKDNIRSGLVRFFYPSGRLHYEWLYTDGKPNGLCKTFAESGVLEQDSFYENGIVNGMVRFYYPSGKLKQESLYSDGKPNGEFKIFLENGQLSQNGNRINGVPNGLIYHYYEDQTIKSQENYQNGVLSGMVRFYYPSGKLKQEVLYSDGKPNGEFKVFLENGQLSKSVVKKNGVLHGVLCHYSEDGTLENREHYENGFIQPTPIL